MLYNLESVPQSCSEVVCLIHKLKKINGLLTHALLSVVTVLPSHLN